MEGFWVELTMIDWEAIVRNGVGVLAGLVLVVTLGALWGGDEDVEVKRVQDHLARALETLRSSPPPGLTPFQWANRLETVEWLEEYRANGVFPHNHVRPGERTPVFVDPHGTPCAVGYLLLRSGERELVDDIVRTDNLVRIPDLAGDERLEGWLSERGLTLAEAAQIQPAYTGPLPQPPPSPYAEETVTLAIVTAASGALAVLSDPRAGSFEWPGFLGAVASLGHTIVLAIDLTSDKRTPAWQSGTNYIGAAAGLVTAIWRYRAAGRAEPQTRVVPSLGPDGKGMGVSVSLRR